MATIPSLALIPSAYKTSKVYSILPSNGDGDFTFTRASSATRVNENGLIETVGNNVPRLDYSDGGCPSLLLEPQRTNRILYSEDFTQWTWGEQGTGTFNQTSITFGESGNSRIFEPVVFSTGETITLSCTFSSADAGKYVRLGYFTGTWNYGSSILIPSNGFVSRTITLTSDVQFIGLIQAISYTNTTLTLKLNAGVQAEQGSYATSYIPTNGSIATRIVETCNDAGNASTFNDSEGVLFFEATALVNGGSNRTITISDGTSANRIYINLSSTPNNWSCVITVNSVSQGNLLANNIPHNQYNKVAVKYKENDFALWINGVERSFDLVGSTFPSDTLNQIDFDFSNGSLPFFGNCKDLRVYDTALTDQELQELTTL